MQNFKIDNKLQPICDFVPIDKPQFRGEEAAMRRLIWDLYHRAAEAVKSFALLMDNQRYYDAFLVAGNAIEVAGVFSYIKDGATEAEQKAAYIRYLACATRARLIATLRQSYTLEKNYDWETYLGVLKTFEPIGAN